MLASTARASSSMLPELSSAMMMSTGSRTISTSALAVAQVPASSAAGAAPVPPPAAGDAMPEPRIGSDGMAAGGADAGPSSTTTCGPAELPAALQAAAPPRQAAPTRQPPHGHLPERFVGECTLAITL